MTHANTMNRRSFICRVSLLAGLAATGALAGRAFAAEAAKDADSADAQGSADAADTQDADVLGELPDGTQITRKGQDVRALVEGGANIVSRSEYNVYTLENDGVDNSNKTTVYYDLDADQIVDIECEEVLMPSTGGTGDWAQPDEETAAKLGDDVLQAGDYTYAKYFELGGSTWEGVVAGTMVDYSGKVGGAEVDLVEFVATEEGGAWYHGVYADGAKLLDAAGDDVADVQIPTKASANHGVDFWPSTRKFPGNVELIKDYLYENGTEGYDYFTYGEPSDTICQNDDGEWVVCDVVTGATLSSTPVYLNMAKRAVEAIKAGDCDVVTVDDAPSFDDDADEDAAQEKSAK